jgi:hypothetical protein
MVMKAGDILFVRGEGLVSNMVRLIDKGEFSHVCIAVSETHILEAQYFTESRITNIYFDDFEIVDLGLNDQKNKLLEIAIDLTGKGYDFLHALSYLFNLKYNNPDTLICTEVVAQMLFRLGLIDNLQIYENMKPNELYRKLKGVV